MQLLWVECHDRSLCDIQLNGRVVLGIFQALYSEYERIILSMNLINIIRSDSELNGVGSYYDRCHHAAPVWNPCLGCSIIRESQRTWVDTAVTATVVC